ncbi:uncharacterized protein LOC109851883 [Pseudomyrmex gracilis]|uniref:uncharacterized protein LOC109851883 n=1 Tax=Pseudomyrmex gracilis TaxID=219809 RepID=UPI000995BFAC|nr:uncharacterized protein LOC109851883 [Pseudomyrmex gracilis]
MTYDVSEVISDSSVKMIHSKHQQSVHQHQQHNMRKSVGVMGNTRRIFTTDFKIKVLDSYRHDNDCRQNQRATARKYGIHRRQIQKWLQSEEQLRNSVENGNSGVTSSMNISSTGVSKSDDTGTEATGTAMTSAAPTLNLARQLGDELTTQQGPPPPHPPHAPSSPQYSLPTTTTDAAMPLCVTSVNYQEYSSEHDRLEDRVHIPEVPRYPDTQIDQDRTTYYVFNGDRQRDTETSAMFGGRSEVKVYQTLTTYHSARHSEHRYIKSNVHSSDQHSQQPENYGNVDSYDGRSYGSYSLLLPPSMIKTERASPDTAATSGPYEPTSSPGGPRAPLSPASHRAVDSSSSPSSIHFVDYSRGPTSPYLHVHEHAHTCTPLDSEKSISLLYQQKGEPEETKLHTEEKKDEEYCDTIIKEEIHLDENEKYDEEEKATVSSSIDQQPVGRSSPDSSGPISPICIRNGYSVPSSPNNSNSTGRSRSSLSDSEMMDPLASVNSLNSSNNLRRRSFSLRFKLTVLDAFHRDKEVKENQRATARKFGINRRQVQKWLEQETELRDEIAFRGDSRQRLGPIQDVTSGESPLDLTMTNYANCASLLRDRLEMEHEQLSPHFYRYDGSGSSQHPSYYQHSAGIDASSEIEAVGPCHLSCSADSHTTSTTSSYQEYSRESYTEPPTRVHCHSPRANSEVSNLSEGCDQGFSSLKRLLPSCCYERMPSPKRFCERLPDIDDSYDTPLQDAPLCLVKPKSEEVSCLQTELSTTSINTVTTSNNSDAITFKPYLDNPSKSCL